MSWRLKAKAIIRRNQIHVFRTSTVCIVFVFICILQLVQWDIEIERQSDIISRQGLNLWHNPVALIHQLFKRPSARVVEFFESDLPDVKRTVKGQWSSHCPSECNSDQGWGFCDDDRCICSPGFGDNDCSLSIETLYGRHLVYEGYKPRTLDLNEWDVGGNLYKLLVQATAPNLVIDVGVWKGKAAISLAQALQEQGIGVLVAVDMWLPHMEFWENHRPHNRVQDLRLKHGFPDVFHTFVGNVIHENLTDVVIPFPTSPKMAAEFFSRRKSQAELIYLDASHEYQDVTLDIRMWWGILRNGGVLLGDDWSLDWPGVLSAVRHHAKRYQLVINVYRNKWWIQKPLHFNSKT